MKGFSPICPRCGLEMPGGITCLASGSSQVEGHSASRVAFAARWTSALNLRVPTVEKWFLPITAGPKLPRRRDKSRNESCG
jgi:hypothetical protein